MARSRASDYDAKRAALLKGAAREFAAHGYDRTSMNAVAAGCGVSKALLYHYYASKEALLFDIIHRHLGDLVAAAAAAADEAADPRARLGALVLALLEAYRDADSEHKVQLDALSALPEPLQAQVRARERRLVTLFAESIRAAHPGLDEAMLKPATMSLFGMLNWFYMWFREGGALTREAYARMVTAIFLDGVRSLR